MTTRCPALILLLLLLASGLAGRSFAGEINFAWDPSAGADGYTAHYGTIPGQYSVTVDVENATEIDISALTDCTTWYFTATAYNAGGASAFPGEISSWPRPVINAVSPSTAEQGRTVNVTLSGTNFQSGDTLQFSDPNIQVNSMSVDSCGSVTAGITVGASAAAGPVEVTVTHASGVAGHGVGLFTVEPATAPTVVSASPQDGATGVSTDVTPSVQFNEPMLPASISTATVRLLDGGGNPVGQASGSPALSADGLVATIVPAAALGEGATYRIQVIGGAAGARDLAGQALGATYVQGTGFVVADPSAPQLSSIQAGGITGTSALITWTSDEPADSQVFYRRSGDSTYQQTAVDSTLVTSHSVQLGGLDPDTTYEYNVRSTDAAGNTATSSPDQSFTTTDTVAPQLGSIQAGNVADTSALISWTTDEPATGQVFYRRLGDSTYQQSAVNSTLVTTHSLQLGELDSGTTYEYNVRSVDAVGNSATSSPDQTFTTTDTSAPQIGSVQVGSVTESSAQITWTTDQAADSQVFYRRSGDSTYLQTTVNPVLVTNHSVPLSGLDPGTTYEYNVRSADSAGNAAVSSPDQTFTTTDTAAPQLSSIQSSAVTGTSAVITWTSDEPADSQVFYRRSGDSTYQQTLVDSTLVTSHTVALSSLDSSTAYDYHVRSADSSGNATVSSPDQNFTTATTSFSYITVEAEAGTLTAPIVVVNGSGAFGDAWIELPVGESSGTPNSPSGTAVFDVFTPSTGTWYLWVRMYGADGTSDSWFESIDGATRDRVFNGQTGVWEWVAGRSYVLAQGLHSVELGGREAGARADQILLTDDPDFVPTSQPEGDQTPPAPVAQFTANPVLETNELGWTNPADDDFSRTIIRYRTDGHYPVSPTDGLPVADRAAAPGSSDAFTHSGLTSGVTYYYSAFAVDETGNAAAPAQAQAQPSLVQPPLPPGGLMLTFLDSAPNVQDANSGTDGWNPARRWAERRRWSYGTA